MDDGDADEAFTATPGAAEVPPEGSDEVPPEVAPKVSSEVTPASPTESPHETPNEAAAASPAATGPVSAPDVPPDAEPPGSFMSRLDAAWNRVCVIDFSSPRAWWALCAAVVLSRLPLLGLGFGRGPDSWRIANSALHLWNEQTYLSSRGLGYPTVEFAMAPFIWGGWWMTNSLTLAVSLLGIWCFARIVRNLEVRHGGWVVLTYAFTPLVWIHTSNSIDFMWGLSLLLCTWWLVQEDRLHAGAVVLGLAAGARVSGVFLGPAFAWMVWRRDHDWRATLWFSLISSAVTLLLYAPSFAARGLDVFEAYGSAPVSAWTAIVVVVDVYGKLAIAVGVVAAALALPSVVRRVRAMGSDEGWATRDALLFAAGTMVVMVLIFPANKPEYTLPLLPAFLIVLAQNAPGRVAPLVMVLLLSKSVVGVNFSGVTDPFDETSPLVEPGLVWDNAAARSEQLAYTEWLVETSGELNHSLVIAGWYSTEMIWFEGGSSNHEIWYDEERDVYVRSLVDESQLRGFLERGYTVYHSKVASEHTQRAYGYDPAEFGSVSITMAPGASAPPS